ncbi:hypothetical protein LA080_005697 [Diaporthe eres]|nr:hypothetical protein LA080_005697 [Diaporthe eres]
MSAPDPSSPSPAAASDAAIHVAVADEIEVAADDDTPERQIQPDGPADGHEEKEKQQPELQQQQQQQQQQQPPLETPQPDPDPQGQHDAQGPHAEDSARHASSHEALNGHGSGSGQENDELKGHACLPMLSHALLRLAVHAVPRKPWIPRDRPSLPFAPSSCPSVSSYHEVGLPDLPPSTPNSRKDIA